ncbi:RCC1 domain-containing protein [Pseudomonas sp. Marseille-P9899]|uniref:RCC1 domain-containing protein n=1 Tax=Pseudomonas sp. Marseille-P9899 TaxID=2730401 RepID=UPI00158B6BFC|nr:hypothetical protein [Pseudomonas sp. Marseille-P9899]
MTIDEHIANHQAVAVNALGEILAQYNRRLKAKPGRSDSANLDPIYIPGMITPVMTGDADGGVNHHLAHANASGLLVVIQQYSNMLEGDWINVFWGNESTPVASNVVLKEHLGKNFPMYIATNKVPEGVNSLYCTVTRAGGGNGGESAPIDIFVRTEFPGGVDPEPDLPGHQNLPAPKPDLPANGIIDEDAAEDGVKVTISSYPNMRQYDKITLSWGGELVVHEVTEAEAQRGSVDILVSKEMILAAGDSDDLVLVYRVMDEVHNQSSDWSVRTYVAVEVGTGLFDAPLIANPDLDADPYDVIDLDKLGDEDLYIDVMVERDGSLEKGDVVALKWVGTTAQGQDIIVEPDPQTVNRVPAVLTFDIPNAELKQLARGRGIASYTVTRNGSPAGVSKRAFATFLGVEQRLPKPTVTEAEGGVLDPELGSATVVVPGAALEAGDVVILTWLGTHSNGSPLLYTAQRGVSGGTAGKPMSFTIDGDAYVKPLNGGRVSVYYSLGKAGGGQLLESDRELLMVGEAQFELPAPSTRPAAQGGMLDPETLPAQLEIVIPPYPNMVEGQTVYMVWKASEGPNYTDFMPINALMVGKEVVFYMNREQVEENLGAEVTVSYRVESDGDPTRTSAPTTFSIGEQQGSLPLPVVLEAKDDVLNPSDAIRGATVQIPIEAELQFGDDVEVHWDGSKPGGVTTVNRLVQEIDVGKPFDLLVGYEYVQANADGNVVVSYKVFGADGVRDSGALTLSVQSAALPLPEFVEATDDNQLNPDDVTAGATVLIPASAHFQQGDRVTVAVVGSAPGGDVEIPYVVPVGGAGQPVRVVVPYAVINANVGQVIHLKYEVTRSGGGPVEDSPVNAYAVNRQVGSGPLRVMGARFSASSYRASSAPRMLSAFHNTTLQPVLAEWRYEDSEIWTAKTRWFDNKPWLKLYVRTTSDAVLLNPANIIGNGVDSAVTGAAAFIAMRDEVTVGSEKEVDVVGWGNAAHGGVLDPNLITIKDIVEVSCTSSAYAARRRNGHVVCWGTAGSGGVMPPGETGNYVQVRSNSGAFVGQKSDGRLFAWGTAGSGVPVSPEVLQYTDYVELCGAGMAFAALRATGHIMAWGDAAHGGVLLPGQEGMSDIVQITGNYGAFAALRDGGGSQSVIAWGSETYGGAVPTEIAQLTNVKALGAATAQAFSILLDTSAVRAWGADTHGGTVPENIKSMTNVVEVSSTWHAFCARLNNGHVVAWGHVDNGGTVPEPIARLSNIVQVVGSSWSFAALCRDGTVVAWGDGATGGDISSVAAQLVNVRAVYANTHGFTALTSDGRVVTWGVAAGGGDSSAQQPELVQKVTTGRTVSPAEAQTVIDAQRIASA